MRRFLIWVVLPVALATAIVPNSSAINRWLLVLLERTATAVEAVVRRVAPRGGVPAELPPTLESAPAPRWQFQGPRFPYATDPVVDSAGRIITTTTEDLVVLDSGGREQARTRVGEADDLRLGRPVLLADGRVAVPARGRVVLFNSAGVRQGEIRAGQDSLVPEGLWPLADGGLAIATAARAPWETASSLSTFDAKGVERWRFDLGTHRVSAVASSEDGTVLVDIAGVPWRFDAGGARQRIERPPVSAALPGCGAEPFTYGRETEVRYGLCGKNVHAVTDDGRILWTRAFPWLGAFSPVVMADGTVYVVGDGLYALGRDGTERWHTRLWFQHRSTTAKLPVVPANISTPPLIGPDGTVYVGSRESRLYAITPDGRVRWVYPVVSDDSSPAAVSQLSFLDGGLLISAGGLSVLPVPGARLQPMTGERPDGRTF